jgi:hypothetical protein
VSATLLNIVIGLITSILSGGSVWAWRRVKDARILRRKAAFFGLDPGTTCLIVMNNHWQKPGSTSHSDVHTMIEVATLAADTGCPVSVLPGDDLRESNGDRTEFCIGGPTSNPRTAGHLASHLPGVRYRPYSAKRDSGAILVAGQQFLFDHGRLEHALIAKFTPPHSSRPVIVIAGHRALDNQAVIHFLMREYRTLSKIVDSLDRFCLILRVNSSDTYGFQATELAADVTAAAFTAHRQAPVATGNSPQS